MVKVNPYLEDVLQIFQADLPWNDLSGCNLLVAGGTGLIGGCIVDALMMNPKKNYNVYVLGRNENRAKERFSDYIDMDAFHFINHDVSEPLLEFDEQFDYIIDAASGAAPFDFERSSVEVIKSNVNGVCNLIEYGLAHNMQRFLYVSSGEVYGKGDGCSLSEDYSGSINWTLPRACYPSSKRLAETLCVSYTSEYGADVVIVRPCHTYGPFFTESDDRAYAQFLRDILRGNNVVLKSDGLQLRSWCYVVDCVAAIFYVLLHGVKGEAYNITGKESDVTIMEFAEAIATIGCKKVVFANPAINEVKDYNKSVGSILSANKIKRLGWEPKYTLQKGLVNSYHSLKKWCLLRGNTYINTSTNK